MLGSSMSISGPNIALNTIMAEELGQFADILEQAEDFDSALQQLVCDTLTAHQRILYNGNCYSDEWKQEAARRGLSNLPSTADALTAYLSPKNIDLVTKHGIFTEAEFHARYEIYLQAYCKIVGIEARTTADMIIQQILPAAMKYTDFLCGAVARKTAVGASCKAEKELLTKLSAVTDALYEQVEQLKLDLSRVPAASDEASHYYRNTIVTAMEAIRKNADVLEQLTDKSYWPYPTYSDLLFY
jgi:glutamine synthetase